MKSYYFGCVLMGFFSLALYKTSAFKFIRGNLKDHGWDGPIPIDTKTGLLHPPLSMYSESAEHLSLWGPHANLYCKILDSGSIFHNRYYKDLCHKRENGKKVDLCCRGYTCKRYGLGGGHMCERIENNQPRCNKCKPPLCKPRKLCSSDVPINN